LTELSVAVSPTVTPSAAVATVTEAVTSATCRLMFSDTISPLWMVMGLLLALKPSELASST
jgi:hypothetical protein